MTRPSAKEIDPADTEHRELGKGLLEEDMGPSSATAHLYRGEIHRMTFWRERLDRTTNWAVVVISAILTWAFSRPQAPHYILLIGIATLAVFLAIEARRYRGYDIWRSRVRKLQENVFAYGLDPSAGMPDPNWREKLSQDYRTPTIKITPEEAIAHRLRRIYLPLFTVLLAAWVVRITVFSPESWAVSAAIGGIPGEAVIVLVVLFYVGTAIVALRPRTWHAKGELRSKNLRK
ncbi:DUF2270 domain-containing protein [Halocatena salina]|uniref:DUF2270 domain-containing protein n=1 Tax=Halocatena salina TaxID=2934340 RepID=A0A8U0A827_9EURY|nr:DUF2270 domain-containing protein [Halocatena salina]UPM45134.1 DUF2270 domain-containing protein [Halocatena salina]